MNNNSIVVVGGGLIGLSVALALQKLKCSVTLIESRPILKNFTSVEQRVSAINHESMRFLDSIGVWDKLALSTYYNMHIVDDCQPLHINAEEVNRPNLGYIIENNQIINALYNEINYNSDVTVLEDTNISNIIHSKNKRSCIMLENDNIVYADIIIGADGANSYIRNSCNIALSKKSYQQSAIVGTFKMEAEHNKAAYQRFFNQDILALLPLAKSNRVSIVWSMSTKKCQSYIAENDINKFEYDLCKMTQKKYGKLSLLSEKLISFDLNAQHAVDYVRPRVALVGDAMHTIHPLAGQGVNLGFKDVQVLVNILHDECIKGRAIGFDTLKRYERRRKCDIYLYLCAMLGIKSFFASKQQSVFSILRQLGLKKCNQSDIIKRLIVEVALGK